MKIATPGALLLALALVTPAFAGMGAVRPTYHPKPCEGGDCRGDDDRSGMPCQRLLCGFTSAKSLQKPVTPSEAAEMQAKAAAAADQAKTAAAPTEPPAPAIPKTKRKKAAKPSKPAAATAKADAADVAQAR